MQTEFIVVASNPNKTGGFVWKLQVQTSAKAFGITKTVKRTFYIGGMPTAATIGAKLTEDLSRFDVVERDFVTEDEAGETVTMKLKWLHVKAA